MDTLLPDLLAVIRKHWGFTSLRPLQEAAIRAVLDKRDSLLVLPTGGGKSLCYQAPAVFRGQTTVVLSPLISLMKDQVDALRANGVAAVALNSSVSSEETREAQKAILRGEIRLVFASPERMATAGFRNLVHQANVATIAIDEAHCISHWGHDFRPEYRQLKHLKTIFPNVSVHGFTATATERVRQDIVEQLGLQQADVMVGSFDRPNLTYRVIPRDEVYSQVRECMARHPGEAGIIYCIRKKEVDLLAEQLRQAGVRVRAYHAGLPADVRKEAQEVFINEECDVVVATVAFGMGIDRSNIRYVMHTGMPKSIEHYQQETGRAGRDGLEAECVLLYSAGDTFTWKSLIDKSAAESQAQVDPQYLKAAHKHLADMDRYCRPIVCRHRSLVEYFGQAYEVENCGACDLCLGDAKPVPDAQTIAKKILSCVSRVQERFGINHVMEVLRGADTQSIRQWKHEALSTYGLLKDVDKSDLRDWIHQLIGQGALEQAGDDRPILKLNTLSWDVMKDRTPVRLLQQPGKKDGSSRKASAGDTVSWEGVDRPLFDAMRDLRRQLAAQKGVPPYVIFSDATLRELARSRPSSLSTLHQVYGVGAAKLAEYGQAFLDVIEPHSTERNLTRDVRLDRPAADIEPAGISRGAQPAAALFRQGLSIEEVCTRLGRARSTTVQYLGEFVQHEKPASIDAWVRPEVYREIVEAAKGLGADRLKPVFEALGGRVSYDDIRISLRHWQNQFQQ